jgi:phage head maturation protease
MANETEGPAVFLAQAGRDLMCSLKRGDVTGSSFSFEYDDVDESDV